MSLRDRALAGHKFRRQHPIGPDILDFYCAAARLAVEVDGAVHSDPAQAAHDRRRTSWLKDRGVRVVRLAAEDVRVALPEVLDYLAGVVATRLAAESPPPSRR